MERTLAGADTRVPGLRRAEHPGLVEVWILSQEKSIGNDRADQRSYEEGYQVFSRLYGDDELKNGPKGAIWFYFFPGYPPLMVRFSVTLNRAFEQQPVDMRYLTDFHQWVL
jgi:hypothetical protein